MANVYVLTHSHEFEDGHEDLKIIGIYTKRTNAIAARERRREQPGFRKLPKGFSITKWELDSSGAWAEGYVTAYPGGTFSD